MNGASYKWPVRHLGKSLLHGLLCDTNLLTFLTYFNYEAIKSEIITFSTYCKGSINFQALNRIPAKLSCSDLSSWSPDRNTPISILQGVLQPVVTQLKLQMIVASSQSLDQGIFLLKKYFKSSFLDFFLKSQINLLKKNEYRNI